MRRRKSHFKIYQVIGILVLCIALVLVTYNVTTAWFLDQSITSNKPNISIIGTVELDVTTNFDFYNLALAPDTIYTEDQLGNDIGTYIRTADATDIHNSTDNKAIYIRVKYITNRSELTLYFNPSKYTTATTYSSSEKEKWVYNASDNYYYYLGAVGDTAIQFNAGYAVDNTLSNEDSNDDVSISITVDAIQRPYGAYKEEVTWEDAPVIFKDFAADDSGVAWK